MKKVLIIGSGGREHILAKKLNQSSRVDKIFVMPGNAGTQEIATNIDMNILNFNKVANFAKKNEIDMTFVGPERPLVEGIVDYFNKKDLNIFGPNQKAAKLEGSKVYAKNIMESCNIPTAKFATFTEAKKAYNYIRDCEYPLVIKAEGLAAGKGVIITKNIKEAQDAIKKIMIDKDFGNAGDNIVIEEYLEGEEASIMFFSDGQTYYPMISAQDHKQIGEGDKGPNTGGMGAYAPTPLIDDEIQKKVNKKIINPLFNYLKEKNITFKGILFVGLMVAKGEPKVLEFNVRFGDPEAQVVLPLLENDLLTVAEKVTKGSLDHINLKWKEEKAMAVILASGGYPIDYPKGKKIKGISKFKNNYNPFIIQAGTKYENGEILSSGGRVLSVVATGKSYQEVYDFCYENIEKIEFDGAYYRRDIGHRIKGVNLIIDE
ncbi:MAG: phosphoribosylamine--glycine ligase [Halanaerobiales bacterium]|nr:phosphoribosylamine--glycine ligase [Halanaerobiales bacterium]